MNYAIKRRRARVRLIWIAAILGLVVMAVSARNEFVAVAYTESIV